MENRRLPSDLVSVIHYIKLNEVGWWENSLYRIILVVLWLENKPLMINELKKCIELNLGLNVLISEISTQIERLLDDEKIYESSKDSYMITKQSKGELQNNIDETERLNENVYKKFISCVKEVDDSINPEDLWEKFNDDLIIPSVKEMGSQLYQLLVGENPSFEKIYGFNQFICNFPEDKKEKIAKIIFTFLASPDYEIRVYILSFLRAYFILESGKLDNDTIDSLYQSMTTQPKLSIFVDTNFMFSILGIHDNPSNEDAESLLGLLESLEKQMKVKLYVLPITLEETRRAIQWKVDEAQNITFGKNIAYATLNSGYLSGFLSKIIKEVDKSGQKLSVEEFYGPYITNLLDIVRSKGVELFNCDPSKIKADKEVQADIADQSAFEEEKYGRNAKNYNAIKHDMILWHFINRKREDIIESPLDVEYWVVTVDFHFLRFDRYKRNYLSEKYPVTVHPSTLIQLLQFWIPRTSEFEKIIYRSWLSPLFFEDFNSETESVTIQIIKTLSRYENIDDLPQEIVRNVLIDEALRQKFSGEVEKTDEEIKKLIDEHLILETRNLAGKLENQKEELGKKESIISQQEQSLDSKGKIISEKEKEIDELQGRLISNEDDKKRVEEDNKRFRRQERMRRKKHYKFYWLILPIIIILVLFLFTLYLLFYFTKYHFPVLLFIIYLIIYLIASSFIYTKKLVNSEFNLENEVNCFNKVKKWLFITLLISIFIEILANYAITEYSSFIDLLK